MTRAISPTPHYQVTREWMESTGRPASGVRVFEVMRAWRGGHLTFAALRVPWSPAPWVVVADWRGRFI